MRAAFPIRHAAITGSEDAATIEYFPSYEREVALSDEVIRGLEGDREQVESLLAAAIEQRAQEETARRMSLVGPHRDKPAFYLNGRPAADFASQGQQRSMAIAYKLAEMQLIEDTTHVKPILLLDDVMSELDATRRATLTRYVHEAAQTFITTTNLDYFTPELLETAQVIHLPL